MSRDMTEYMIYTIHDERCFITSLKEKKTPFMTSMKMVFMVQIKYTILELSRTNQNQSQRELYEARYLVKGALETNNLHLWSTTSKKSTRK